MVTRHCYMAKQPQVVGRYVYQEMVDATAQTWSNLGKPRTLNKEQTKILQEAANPLRYDSKVFAVDGKITVNIDIECNHLIMMELLTVNDITDTYWEYDKKEFYGLE